MTREEQTFSAAMTLKDKLYAEHYALTKVLNTFPTLSNGLTPDEVKNTNQWRKAFKAERKAFERLRTYNQWMTREFKRELKEHRENIRKQKLELCSRPA